MSPLALGTDHDADQLDAGPITAHALNEFRNHYDNPNLTPTEVIQYVIGILHADDYRRRYRDNLKRELPRIPFADEFEPFRAAGQELMQMQINWRSSDEYCLTPVTPHKDLARCEPRDSVDDDEWVIRAKMDRIYEHLPNGERRIAGIQVNKEVGLIGIPEIANRYRIAGLEPIEYLIRKLRVAADQNGEIYNDPNDLYEHPVELRRHIQQVVWISARSGEIIKALPPSIPKYLRRDKDNGVEG